MNKTALHSLPTRAWGRLQHTVQHDRMAMQHAIQGDARHAQLLRREADVLLGVGEGVQQSGWLSFGCRLRPSGADSIAGTREGPSRPMRSAAAITGELPMITLR